LSTDSSADILCADTKEEEGEEKEEEEEEDDEEEREWLTLAFWNHILLLVLPAVDLNL